MKTSLLLSVGGALLAAVVSGAGVDEYVQDGLIAHWDGVLNVGSNKTHDARSTVWYDLGGRYGFTLNKAYPGDLGIKFAKYGSNYGYGTLSAGDTAATFDLATNGTLEVVAFTPVIDNAVLLQSSTTSGMAVGQYSSGTQLYVCNSASGIASFSFPLMINTVSIPYTAAKSGAVSVNGAEVTMSGSGYWSAADSTTTIGNRTNKGNGFTGTLYALRLYNRKLSAAEIAQNYQADRERFFNRKTAASASYPVVDYTAGVTFTNIIHADVENGDDEYAGADIGSDEHPYRSVNAAHAAVCDYLATNAGHTVAVVLAAGEYLLTAGIKLAAGESIIGAGRDKTFLDASQVGATAAGQPHAVELDYDDNLLRGICVMKLTEGASNTGQKTIYVKKGIVEHCRSAFNRGKYACGGFGMMIAGGTVSNSLVDHISLSDMSANGLAVQITGGVLTDSEICDTDAAAGRSIKGGGLYVNGGTVRCCRIHDNGRSETYSGEEGTAAYLNSGTLENCLVYGNLNNNGSGTSTQPAGVYNVNGTLRYCTIFGNLTVNDATGYSGLKQTGGSGRNNIVFGNATAALGAQIAGGTFETNLLDAAVTGYAVNYTTDDPCFADAGANDFHIVSKASAAVGKATPIAAVTNDFDGVARDPEKPTIGAYEYVAGDEAFAVELLVTQKNWPLGSSPSAELVVAGVTNPAALTVTWYLDGAEVPAMSNLTEAVFAGAGLGNHSIRAVAFYEGVTKESEIAEAFNVLPDKVYVNSDGSGVYPFATFETGTNSLNAAYGALWKDAAVTTVVEIAAGEYDLTESIHADSPVRFEGQGRGVTFVRGAVANACPLSLANAGAYAGGMTIADAVGGYGGVFISAGTMENCHISNCWKKVYSDGGGGVKLTGGRLLDCEIDHCISEAMYAYGGGVAVCGKDAVVSNCYIHANWASYAHNNQNVHGGGLYAMNGLVTHCRIVDNGDQCNPAAPPKGSHGSGVALIAHTSGSSPWATIRNCLIADNQSCYSNAVLFMAGSVENCTIAGNTTDAPVPAVRFEKHVFHGTTYVNLGAWNTVVWGNGGGNLALPEDPLLMPSLSHCCYPQATEGENGNTASDPKLKSAARDYAISPLSTCFRGGTLLGWMTENAVDLLGRPRTTNDKVDIGCHQVAMDGAVIMIR